MIVEFYGYGFGIAGPDTSTESGPETIKNSSIMQELSFQHKWNEILKPRHELDKISALEDYNRRFMAQFANCHNKFCVFGGDHTSAISTVQATQLKHENIKLIWVDAHMDLHNLASSHSKNMHGMSLAVLLGESDAGLKKLEHIQNIKAHDICLFGSRSFESEEQARLNKLGVNVIYMNEITANGLEQSWLKAIEKVNLKQSDKLVLSIDLDAFDPMFAPAVTVPENNGINAENFIQTLKLSKNKWNKQFIGSEIVEFSPKNDISKTTEHLIRDLLNALY